MVITLLAFMVIAGFLLGDGILCWRIVWREVNGKDIADMRKPLSWTANGTLSLLLLAIWVLGLQQSLGQ